LTPLSPFRLISTLSHHLDYCNILFSGLPASSISRLPYIPNSAARILAYTKNSAHMTPILHCTLVSPLFNLSISVHRNWKTLPRSLSCFKNISENKSILWYFYEHNCLKTMSISKENNYYITNC